MTASKIRDIWLQQPIAFARVGGSGTPLEAFQWTLPDLRPRGTGRTAIEPGQSYDVDPQNGTLRLRPNLDKIIFKDQQGIRPVCPFYELHGDWEGRSEGEGTALTTSLLERFGLGLHSISWHIRHANHKAYALTGSDGDRVEAEVSIRGDDHSMHRLVGSSRGEKPLVRPDQGIDMGRIQIVRPTLEQPSIRLRFLAPPGQVYGPCDLGERLSKKSGLDRLTLGRLNRQWAAFRLPADKCILNPEADWPNYKLLTYQQIYRSIPRILSRFVSFLALCRHVQRSELLRFLLGPLADAGKLPPGVFAFRYGGGALLSSLGLIDDLGDSVITCKLDGHFARARIVVCPPHFSPDRRPPVSIADDLTDRVRRQDVRSRDWASHAMAELEIDDLFDRAFETAGLTNIDACIDELGRENVSDAIYRGDKEVPRDPSTLLWPDRSNETVLDLPMTDQGRWRHRRNSADEFLVQLMRDSPDLLETWVRNPDDGPSLYYDRRMPALMRGSDRRPLHLTRRQLGALRQWAQRLRETGRWSE